MVNWATKFAMILLLGFSTVGIANKTKDFNLSYPHVPNELIVKFKAGFESSQKNILRKIKAVSKTTFKSSGAQVLVFSENIQGDVELFNRAKKLASMPAVEYVEANTIISLDGTVVPDDPEFDKTYGLHNDGSTGGLSDSDIDAPEAWEISTGSKDILVAVIDTGVDHTHTDLSGNYWNNQGEMGVDASGQDKKTNGIDDDNNGYADDWRGWDFVNNDNDPIDDHNHGTHVAGTIGAVGNDGHGVAGVNWSVSIVGIKFLSASGSGSLEDAVLAIEYATTIGARLSNNSWGGGAFSETMKAAIQHADDGGVLFIAAAGNSNADNDTRPHYPSSYQVDNVISVAATDHKDEMASFSSYGLTTVHLAAPGVNTFSTVAGNSYGTMSGTSMATPHVAGAVALVMSAYPGASHSEIKSKLLKTVDPIPSVATKTITGGRLNVYNAIENDLIPPNKIAGLTLDGAFLTSIDLSWQASGDDGNVGAASRYFFRVSENPILTEADWNSATPMLVQPTFANGKFSGVLDGMSFDAQGYVASRAFDNAGNQSAISDSIFFKVKKAVTTFQNKADTMEGVVVTGTWGLQGIGSNSVFSDSPAGTYSDKSEAYLELGEINVTSNQFILAFNNKYEFETNYDYGVLLVSVDNGANWIELNKVSGSSDWKTEFFDLRPVMPEGTGTLKIRFQIDSDFSMNKDGWLIDDVSLLTSAE